MSNLSLPFTQKTLTSIHKTVQIWILHFFNVVSGKKILITCLTKCCIHKRYLNTQLARVVDVIDFLSFFSVFSVFLRSSTNTREGLKNSEKLLLKHFYSQVSTNVFMTVGARNMFFLIL